jgi:two-component system C4-dicarboxylate transport sensor histidine kinase DctB
LNLDLRSIPADHSQGTDGPALLLTVSDSGGGITVDAADRIFEPFFTTKEIGSGTGLGLAVAKRIVESAGGLIRARSGTEAGAVFEVLLPRAEVLA